VLSGLSQIADQVWFSMKALLDEFVFRIKSLLKVSKFMERELDNWYEQPNTHHSHLDALEKFLRSISSISDEGEDFQVEADGVDTEIADLAGPQLVVPATNERSEVSAIKVRFGSWCVAHLCIPNQFSTCFVRRLSKH